MDKKYQDNVVKTNNLKDIYNTVMEFIHILRYENVENIYFYRDYDALVDFMLSPELALVKRCALVFRDDCVKYHDYEDIKKVRSVVLQCNKYIDAYNSIASLLEFGEDDERVWRSRHWGVLQVLGFDEPITGEDIYADRFKWEDFGIDPEECSKFVIFELFHGNDDDSVVSTNVVSGDGDSLSDEEAQDVTTVMNADVVASDAVSGDGDLPGDSEAQAATTVINADVVAADAVSGNGDLSGGVEVQAAKNVTSAEQVFSAAINYILPRPPPPPPAASGALAVSVKKGPALSPSVGISMGRKEITPEMLKEGIKNMKLKKANSRRPRSRKVTNNSLYKHTKNTLKQMRPYINQSDSDISESDDDKLDDSDDENGVAHT